MSRASLSDDGTRRVRVVGFWRRAAASLVDLIVAGPLALLFAAAVAAAGGHAPRSIAALSPAALIDLALDGGAGLAALAGAAIVAFLYLFVFHALRGQTPGERLVRVRVIDAFGERPSFVRALVRTGGCFLSLFAFGLGVLWVGFDREKRALHDWLAGTYVIDARAPGGSAPRVDALAPPSSVIDGSAA